MLGRNTKKQQILLRQSAILVADLLHYIILSASLFMVFIQHCNTVTQPFCCASVKKRRLSLVEGIAIHLTYLWLSTKVRSSAWHLVHHVS